MNKICSDGDPSHTRVRAAWLRNAQLQHLALRTAACTLTSAVLFSPRVARKLPAGEVCAIAGRDAALLFPVVRSVCLLSFWLWVLKQKVAVQLWACCAAHKAAALREVLKVRTAALLLSSCFNLECMSCLPVRLASTAHLSTVCVGVTCRRCPSCPSRSRLAARARCLTSCWRRRSASS